MDVDVTPTDVPSVAPVEKKKKKKHGTEPVPDIKASTMDVDPPPPTHDEKKEKKRDKKEKKEKERSSKKSDKASA